MVTTKFDQLGQYIGLGLRISGYATTLLLVFFVLKTIYNIYFHPLRKYPGPLLWRASRLPYSFHQARGSLHLAITDLHERYGSTIRIAPDELSFIGPRAWQDIYGTQSGTVPTEKGISSSGAHRPQLQKQAYYYPPSDPTKMPDSLLTLNDAEHARIRRQIAPAFTGRAMDQLEPVLQHYTNVLIEELRLASSENGGTPQNMKEWFSWALNDVIGDLALGAKFECLENRRYHDWPKFLLKALKVSAVMNQFKRFGLWNLIILITPKKITAAGDRFVETTVETTDTRLSLDESGSGRKDMVDLMLQEMKNEAEPLTKLEIGSNAAVLVAAGSETTVVLLNALIYYLATNKEVRDQLVREVRLAFPSSKDITIKNTAKLEYLQAVIEEGLRIFIPSAHIPPRITMAGGNTIDGQWIPPKTTVGVANWFNAHSEKYFDDPYSFRPERWLESKAKTTTHRVHVKEAAQPFSMGARNCIGKLLAYTETRLIISQLLWNFDIELDGDHSDWLEKARFFIVWELRPLLVRLTPVRR